jgi:hypothetical protein
MAKAVSKITTWLSFQQIYAAELARFKSPKPALRAACDQLSKHPHRYLDLNGVRHEGDLTADFIRFADFRPDESSAICPVTFVQGAGSNRRIPHYEAYAIEIWTDGPIEVIDDDELPPHYRHIRAMAGRAFPGGWEHLRQVALLKGVADEFQKDDEPIPERNMMLRALGKRE